MFLSPESINNISFFVFLYSLLRYVNSTDRLGELPATFFGGGMDINPCQTVLKVFIVLEYVFSQ